MLSTGKESVISKISFIKEIPFGLHQKDREAVFRARPNTHRPPTCVSEPKEFPAPTKRWHAEVSCSCIRILGPQLVVLFGGSYKTFRRLSLAGRNVTGHRTIFEGL